MVKRSRGEDNRTLQEGIGGYRAVTRRQRWLAGLLLLGLLCSLTRPSQLEAQTPEPTESAESEADASHEAWLDEMLSRMTTADKVGQLFLVEFDGSDPQPTSDIGRLIQVYRVGGVVISPENDNFRNGPSAPVQGLSLTTTLQELTFSESSPVTITRTIPVTGVLPMAAAESPTETGPVTITTVITLPEVVTLPPQGIPLLVATFQEGNGYPHTSLRGGFTDLPSNMALGATWNA